MKCRNYILLFEMNDYSMSLPIKRNYRKSIFKSNNEKILINAGVTVYFLFNFDNEFWRFVSKLSIKWHQIMSILCGGQFPFRFGWEYTVYAIVYMTEKRYKSYKDWTGIPSKFNAFSHFIFSLSQNLRVKHQSI